MEKYFVKRLACAVLLWVVFVLPVSLRAQINQPVYVSLPDPDSCSRILRFRVSMAT
jgi:hypothetical protein